MFWNFLSVAFIIKLHCQVSRMLGKFKKVEGNMSLRSSEMKNRTRKIFKAFTFQLQIIPFSEQKTKLKNMLQVQRYETFKLADLFYNFQRNLGERNFAAPSKRQNLGFIYYFTLK